MARRSKTWQASRCSSASHSRKRRPSNLGVFRGQQPGRRQVHVADRQVGVDRHITDRGELVKLAVAVAGLGKFELGAPKLLVSHVQLDLVDLEFVDDLPARPRDIAAMSAHEALTSRSARRRSPSDFFAPGVGFFIAIFRFAMIPPPRSPSCRLLRCFGQ